MRRVEENFDKLYGKLNEWGEELILLLPNLGISIVVLLLFWLAAKLVSAGVGQLTRRASGHRALADLVQKVVYLVVILAGVVVALQILNLDKAATTALAGAGIIGLALGFAFQDLTANFIAGVALALQRPMRVDDIVQTNDYMGIVQSIQLRSTSMRTFGGQIVRIPNRKIFEEPLTNYTELKMRRVDLPVGVSYGDDLQKVEDLVLEVVSGLERDTSRDVELFYNEFGDSSINFTVRFWIPFTKQPQYLAAQSAAIKAIKSAFDDNDITIPFPIRTLDFGIKGGETFSEQWTVAQGQKNGPSAPS